MAEKKSSERAPLSSLFALLGAAALLSFVALVWPDQTSLPEKIIYVWAGGLALGLVIWSGRALPGRFSIHWIGNPTLGMVAGVSGGTIAAVALSMTLQSSQNQEATLAAQNTILSSIDENLERSIQENAALLKQQSTLIGQLSLEVQMLKGQLRKQGNLVDGNSEKSKLPNK
jgi:hypothetical protein